MQLQSAIVSLPDAKEAQAESEREGKLKRKKNKMKFNSEKWIAQYKASTAKLALPASAGMVCVHASLSTIRDNLIADIATAGANASGEAKAEAAELAKQITASFGEFWKSLTEAKTLAGFASNASGAAAAAGLKVDKAASNIVDAL